MERQFGFTTASAENSAPLRRAKDDGQSVRLTSRSASATDGDDASELQEDGADAPTALRRASATFTDTWRLRFPFQRIENMPCWSPPRYYLNGTWARMASVDGFRFRYGTTYPGSGNTASVMFSPGIICRQHNAAPVDACDLGTSLKELELAAGKVGLELDWEEAKITELHLTRDVLLPRPLELYWPVLHTQQLLKLSPNYRIRNFPTGLLQTNKTKQWAIYDKAAQVKQLVQNEAFRIRRSYHNKGNALLAQATLGPDRPLRFEFRLKQAKLIRDQLGTDRPLDLLDNYGICQSVMDKILLGSLFKMKPLPIEERTFLELLVADHPEPSAAQLLEWNLQAARKNSRTLFELQGLMLSMQSLGSINVERILAKHWGKSASDLSTFRGKIHAARMRTILPSGHAFATLYEELREAVFARS